MTVSTWHFAATRTTGTDSPAKGHRSAPGWQEQAHLAALSRKCSVAHRVYPNLGGLWPSSFFRLYILYSRFWKSS
jgi:hypothetical protein